MSDPFASGRSGGAATESAEPAGAAESAQSRDEGYARLEAGLDALESARGERVPWWRRTLSSVVPPVVAILTILLVWDAVVWLKVKPAVVMPGPQDVWNALTSQWGPNDIGSAIYHSIYRGLLGFVISIAIGTVIGLAIARFKPLRTAVGPILSGLQNLPSVAWVPVAIIWFGITPAAIYMVVLLGAIPSIAIGLVSGLDQVPPLYLRVGRNLGARGLNSVRFVLLPAALPGYVAGLKQGWAFAWRSLMAAELIAVSPSLGPGIGQVMEFAREQINMPLAFGTIIIILLIGIGINQLIFAPLEKRLLRTRGLARP